MVGSQQQVAAPRPGRAFLSCMNHLIMEAFMNMPTVTSAPQRACVLVVDDSADNLLLMS